MFHQLGFIPSLKCHKFHLNYCVHWSQKMVRPQITKCSFPFEFRSILIYCIWNFVHFLHRIIQFEYWTIILHWWDHEVFKMSFHALWKCFRFIFCRLFVAYTIFQHIGYIFVHTLYVHSICIDFVFWLKPNEN